MTTTENLGLSVYDASSGSAVTFQNYRLAVAGLTSNMTILDSFAGAVSGSFLSLQSSSFNNVNATQTSSNYYSAIVSTITSYLTNMVLNLKVDAANTGASVININSLGNIGLKKVSSTGSVQELSAGDLVANKYYLFTYNGSAFIKIADQITVSAVQNNFISAGSAGVLQDSGVPKLTGVTSGSFYRVYVNQYGQVTSGSPTAPSGGHVIVDNSGSLPQRNYLKFTGTGVSVADTGGSSVVTITSASSGGENITGSGSVNQFAYFSGSQTIAPFDNFIIDESGRPQFNDNLFIVRDEAGAGVFVYNYNDGGNAPYLSGISSRGTQGSPTAVQSGDTLFQVSGIGRTDTGVGTGGRLKIVAAQNFSDAAYGTEIKIEQALVDSTGQIETFKLDSNGSPIFYSEKLYLNGSPITSEWNSEGSPDIPSVSDDEFRAGTLDGKWTVINDSYFFNEFDARGIGFYSAGDNSGELCGIGQAIPSGAFIVWTKLNPLFKLGEQTRCFVFLSDGLTSSNNFYTIGMYGDGSGSLIQKIETWTSGSDITSSLFDYSTSRMDTNIYIRLRYDESDYYIDYSGDGVGWINQYIDGSLPFTPTHIGIGLFNDTPDIDYGFYCRFFRVVEGESGAYWLMPGNYT